jgi:hypothetical protein
MIVGDKVKTLVISLQLQMLVHGTEVIADVQLAGRLYA